jgi:hypothetical protein
MVAVVALMSCRTPAWHGDSPPDRPLPLVRQTGILANPALIETSGLVASFREPDLLWAVNDGGHPGMLYALKTDGRDHGSVAVEGATNIDWEDLAAFERGGRAYILIADVGDNEALRDTCCLYVVPEPGRKAGVFQAAVGVEWRVRFRYEDGPRDCEGVSVDTRTGQILLVTKRTSPPQIYTLPLQPPSDTVVTARRAGEVPLIPPPTFQDRARNPYFGHLLSQPTAFDIRRDNRLAVVLTYKNAYLFPRTADETWPLALARKPWVVRLPKLAQQETACFSPDGRALYVSTEKRPAPLLKVDLTGIL